MTPLALLLSILAAVLVASFAVEAGRSAPSTPWRTGWRPADTRERYLTIDGMRLRALVAGKGPPIVLMHTLRTQIELFHEVIPALSEDFEVHAFDFPGHGYSEIVPGPYGTELFARAARGYLRRAGLANETLVGESIGGAIALQLAAEDDPHVARVIAINSYDYDRGRGIERGSLLSRVLFSMTRVPVLAETVWRLRWPGIFARVIRGSVHDPDRLDPGLVRHLHDIGNRPGHYRAFISLIRHFPQWETLRRRHGDIRCPVALLYGQHDWSYPEERTAAGTLIPGAKMTVVDGAGHLLSFDRPEAVVAAVREAAGDSHD